MEESKNRLPDGQSKVITMISDLSELRFLWHVLVLNSIDVRSCNSIKLLRSVYELRLLRWSIGRVLSILTDGICAE